MGRATSLPVQHVAPVCSIVKNWGLHWDPSKEGQCGGSLVGCCAAPVFLHVEGFAWRLQHSPRNKASTAHRSRLEPGWVKRFQEACGVLEKVWPLGSSLIGRAKMLERKLL